MRRYSDDFDTDKSHQSTKLYKYTFVTFLIKEIDAIKNAITYHYSNGLVEGINDKIKAIKRQMYGRSKTGLLTKNTCSCGWSSPKIPTFRAIVM